jgi:hypothetical protein
MENIVKYSEGFLQGVKLGKQQFLNSLGKESIEAIKEYVDTMARMNPAALHHIYEWYQTGSPSARLFDLRYTVSNLGLSFRSEFRQSTTVARGSTKPFYDKARIMEEGIPVTIRPTRAKVLSFVDDGEQVFTKGPVTIENPGGSAVQGSFEKTLEEFISVYFTQAFMLSSNIGKYLSSPTVYKKNLPAGARSGKAKGIDTGYRWIANAAIGGA